MQNDRNGPRMPAAFALLKKQRQNDTSLTYVPPSPLRSPHSFTKRSASKSCENFGIAYSTPQEAAELAHQVETSLDLSDVLDTYQEEPDSSSELPDSRDRYGFRTTQPSNAQYEDILVRRKRKWDVMLHESGLTDRIPFHFPPRSSKVQRYIRKGVPPEYRGHAWFFYSNAYRLLSVHPGLYEQLAHEADQLDDANAEFIERDLHRTYPDNVYFRPDGYIKPQTTKRTDDPEPAIIASLRRVLQAFALYRPKTGYCQSLNFMAGLFLLFLSEEKSFWMLVVTTSEYLPNVHDINLEGANVDQAVFMLLVRDYLPTLWTKMGSGQDTMTPSDPPITTDEMIMKLPPITLVTTSWFMSVFTGALPIETTLRVWDCFFYEGSRILFRIALTILKLGESKIMASKEPMDLFQIVQNLPKSIYDPTILLDACFRRRAFNNITQKEIDSCRTRVAKVRARSVRRSRDDAAQDSPRSVRKWR